MDYVTAMKTLQISDYCVSETGTIRDALAVIDRCGIGLAIVCTAPFRVTGVISDGDIRRALLAGKTLESPILPHVATRYIRVAPGAKRAEVLELMQARRLQQIPIVDEAEILHGIHTLHGMLGGEIRDNWAVIMAGGKGTRLGAITSNIPKPMLPVAGRPILERLVLHVMSFGVRRIFLSVNHLGHIIEEHFGDGEKFGCQIEYIRETQPMGSGGALSLLPEAPSAPVFVLNGDLVTQADMGAMLEFHNQGNYHATMGVRPYQHEIPFGCVQADQGRMTLLEEKPVIERQINSGIYVFSPEALIHIPPNTPFPITDLFGNALASKVACGAYLIQDDWIDVGQPSQLAQARGLQ